MIFLPKLIALAARPVGISIEDASELGVPPNRMRIFMGSWMLFTFLLFIWALGADQGVPSGAAQARLAWSGLALFRWVVLTEFFAAIALISQVIEVKLTGSRASQGRARTRGHKYRSSRNTEGAPKRALPIPINRMTV